MSKKYRMIKQVRTAGYDFVVGEDSPRHPGLRVSQIDFMQTGVQGIYNPINMPVPHYRIALEDPFHPEDNTFSIIPLAEVKSLDFQEIVERDAEEIDPVQAE